MMPARKSDQRRKAIIQGHDSTGRELGDCSHPWGIHFKYMTSLPPIQEASSYSLSLQRMVLRLYASSERSKQTTNKHSTCENESSRIKSFLRLTFFGTQSTEGPHMNLDENTKITIDHNE
jgi:hypothetical protein